LTIFLTADLGLLRVMTGMGELQFLQSGRVTLPNPFSAGVGRDTTLLDQEKSRSPRVRRGV